MAKSKNDSIQKILLLLGAFIIAYNITIAFHELGHVIACFINGSQLSEFV